MLNWQEPIYSAPLGHKVRNKHIAAWARLAIASDSWDSESYVRSRDSFPTLPIPAALAW